MPPSGCTSVLNVQELCTSEFTGNLPVTPLSAGLYPALFSHLRDKGSYLRRGLKGGVDGNLWQVPVVDVLVAIPHTVDQVRLKNRGATLESR